MATGPIHDGTPAHEANHRAAEVWTDGLLQLLGQHPEHRLEPLAGRPDGARAADALRDLELGVKPLAHGRTQQSPQCRAVEAKAFGRLLRVARSQ